MAVGPTRILLAASDAEGATPSPTGEDALAPYLEFIHYNEERLKRSDISQEEKQSTQRALRELHQWALHQREAELRRRMPVEVYLELKHAREQHEREEATRQAAIAAKQAAVDAKLEEFFDWAERRWAEAAQERVRLIAPRHLLTEHPLRTQSLDALTNAVLDWALTHTQDEDFVRKSPSEVALYLLARNSALATAIELGRLAPPHLDYTPLPDTSIPPEELVLELLAGFTPGIGEVTDAGGLLLGHSITGRKLEPAERLLCGVAVLLPFVSGQTLAGAEMVERAALVTGRSLGEVRVLQRVATHLKPEEASQVSTLMRHVSRGGKLSDEDVAFLRRVAAGLEKPLAEAAGTLRRGGKVPLVGSRLGEAGIRLEPGSAEHMAAAWVDYQFRHPGKYPHFRFAIDDDWRKKYELILKNKKAGGELEKAVLKTRNQEKNRALMMPPPGSEAQGFIPDAVPRNPTPGELVWGQPYDFLEVKGRKELALTGNLEAMLEYVDRYGGFIELWVRSSKHPEGATKLSKPLRDRIEKLKEQHRAAVYAFPP
ncbi:MAG TPA: hypothetical protein VNA24_18955 [Hyalangium sp.]|nr:hypothetical protein [Hyalangium sp.]